MKKGIIIIIVLALIGLIAACGQTNDLMKEIDGIVSEVENGIEDAIDTIEDMDIDLDGDIFETAKNLIPMDGSIKEKAKELDIDVDELYGFIVEQTIFDADNMGKTIPEFLEYLKLNDMTPLEGIENAASMLDGDILALMDLKELEKQLSEGGIQEAIDGLDVDIKDDLKEKLVYKNSTSTLGTSEAFTFSSEANIEDTVKYYQKLLKDTDNYMTTNQEGIGDIIAGSLEGKEVVVIVTSYSNITQVSVEIN